MGSKLFSKVARYLTLSFASLAASVICSTSCLQELLVLSDVGSKSQRDYEADDAADKMVLKQSQQCDKVKLPKVQGFTTVMLRSFTFTSTSFQRLYCLLRAVLQTPMTRRHSLLFICSVTELNLAIRTRQNSNSVSGPDSSFRGVAVPASLSASRASVCLHHSAKTCKADQHLEKAYYMPLRT